MDVRAAVAHKAGAPLSLETVQRERPKGGEALVEIKATGICHTDEYTLSGADPEGLFPAVLGRSRAYQRQTRDFYRSSGADRARCLSRDGMRTSY